MPIELFKATDVPKAIQLDDEARITEECLRVTTALADKTEDHDEHDGRLKRIAEDAKLLDAEQPRDDPPYKGATTVHVPAALSVDLALSARIYTALATLEKYVNILHETPQDERDAKLLELYANKFMERIDYETTLDEVIKLSGRDGVCFLYHKWAQIKRKTKKHAHRREYDFHMTGEWRTLEEWKKQPATGLNGQPVPAQEYDQWAIQGPIPEGVEYCRDEYSVEKEDALLFDGPDFDTVHPKHMRWWPYGNRCIEKPIIFGHEYWENGDKLDQDGKAGYLDAGKVREMKEFVASDSTKTTGDNKPHYKAFELTLAHIRFDKDETGSPEDWQMVYHEPSHKVLAFLPLCEVWWHGKRPYAIFRPIPDPNGLFGLSWPGMVRQLQEGMTDTLRAYIDAARMQANPAAFVDKRALSNEDKDIFDEGIQPGGVYLLDCDPKAIFNWTGGDNSGVLGPIVEFLGSWLDRISSISAQRSGSQGKTHVTATAVQEALGEGDVAISRQVEAIGKGIVESVKILMGLSYQFAGHDIVKDTWFAVNPQTSYDDMLRVLDPKTIKRFHITAAGSTEGSNMTLQVSRIMAVWQAAVQTPFFNPETEEGLGHLHTLLTMLIERSRIVADAQTLTGSPEEVKAMQEKIALQRAAMQKLAQNVDAMKQQRGQPEQPQQDPEQLARHAEEQHAAGIQSSKLKDEMEIEKHAASMQKHDAEMQGMSERQAQQVKEHEQRLKNMMQTARGQ